MAERSGLDYGHFSDDGMEFIVTRPDTPRDWYNYVWNDRYVSLFSQSGQGESLVQDATGRRFQIVGSRRVFLRDAASGEFWTLQGLPADLAPRDFRCRHGMGWSVIEQSAHGIASSFRCFVPAEGDVELWTIRLRGSGNAPRRFDLFVFFNTAFDGAFRPQAYYPASGRFDAGLQSVFLKKRHPFENADEVSLFLSLSAPVTGFDAALNGFVGHGTEQRPDAVVRGACAGTGCEMEKGCCALQASITLEPGRETVVHAMAGGLVEPGAVAGLRARFFADGAADRACAAVGAQVRERLGGATLETPEAPLNAFVSPWLKRQISLGTRWARVRHNGYRDQMQDIGAFAFIHPAYARGQLHRVLGFQYSTGYAPRTWLDGKILDHDFSDNHMWIPYTVHQLVMETGDLALLEETVPFNDGSRASVYEHVRRAVEYGWADRGLHGLLRIHSGDWNDCLNGVGPQGRGVSVWLSMAWQLANAQLADLARRSGRAADAATAEERGREMRRCVNEHTWDGAWYVRAFDDEGAVLGSRRSEEGRLDLLPQAWAVLADIAEGDRALRAMRSVDELLETELGTATVLDPYSHWNPRIGIASTKTPGTHENGGVYLHACCFKLVADCMLKRHEHVGRAVEKLLPFRVCEGRKPCEPYVLCNSTFAIRDNYRYGTPGQSWGTGAAGWLYVALLNHVLGIRPEFEGLRIDPCLPPDWPSCRVVRPFRGATYRLDFDTRNGYRRVAELRVNGKPLSDTRLPCAAGATYDVAIVMEGR